MFQVRRKKSCIAIILDHFVRVSDLSMDCSVVRTVVIDGIETPTVLKTFTKSQLMLFVVVPDRLICVEERETNFQVYIYARSSSRLSHDYRTIIIVRCSVSCRSRVSRYIQTKYIPTLLVKGIYPKAMQI